MQLNVPAHVPAHLVFDFDIYLSPLLKKDPYRSVMENLPKREPRIFWTPRNGGHWVVAGGSDARFFERYFYPLRSDFWLGESEDARLPGTPVAWVPNGEQYDPSVERFVGSAAMPVASVYHAFWGNNYPVLKKGESLTYAGGEYKADHPSIPGLPAVVNMASAEVVFDGSTPSMILTRPVVATPKPRYCRFTFSTTGANDHLLL